MIHQVIVGQIVSARGVKGEVKVLPLVDDPAFFSRIGRVWLGLTDAGGEPQRILRARPEKGHVLLQLEGIDTRTAAEALTGLKLSVPRSEMPPLEEGLYYHFQLEGLRVQTDDGAFLGILDHIMETGSNDVYVVRSPDGEELLIPATREVVRAVNLEEKTITVSLMEGMFGEE